MFTIQQRFHHRTGVLTVMAPEFLKSASRRLLRESIRRSKCRIHITVVLFPDPLVTRILWHVARRGKIQRGIRIVSLHSQDFAVYNRRTRYLRTAIPPFVAGPDRWLVAVEYAVGEILQAANTWAHAPKAQRSPIRLADVGGIPYGLV